MKKKKEDVQEPSAPFWMTTYGDMVTNMLCFFVLLISFSQIEIEKFRGAMESMKGALGVFPGHESIQQREFVAFDSNQQESELSVVERSEVVEKIIENMNLEESVSVQTTAEGMRVRLGSAILFELGSADLKKDALAVLTGIAGAVEGAYSEILVQGHTDDLPIGTEKFPSNWELSASRAASVVRHLSDKANIPANKLVAVGYSEFQPLVPNDSEQNRQQNRRVEIYIKWR